MKPTVFGDPLASFNMMFSPIQIGGVTLKNRIQVTSHGTYNVDDSGAPDAREAAYWRERARGGAGLLITGTNLVHPSSPFTLGQYKNYGHEAVHGLEQLASAVHEADGVILTQMGHMGQRAHTYQECWGPSAVSWQGKPLGITPHAMSQSEIREMVKAYGDASRRSVDAGIDGIELAVGHGQLINSFLSPVTNVRTDAYGGSLKNRMRFCREIIQEIREQVGSEPMFGYRINASDLTPGGLTENDWIDIAQELEATGVGDYINVSVDFTGSLIPTMFHPHGVFLAWAARIKKAVTVPVFGVGRVTDPEVAEAALRRGDVDMVGMTRAHIADPYLLTKLREGKRADIRPCIGCLQMCVGELWRGRNVSCVYNAATGRELHRSHQIEPAATTGVKTVIVGAGPAGLEVARICAQRGNKVTVFESSSQTGGLFARFATQAGKHEFKRATDWLHTQAEQAGAEFKLGVTADAETISRSNPDGVFIAAGAIHKLPAWADPATSSTYLEALDGRAMEESRIVVVDDHYGRGLTTGLELAQQGKKVTIISAAETVAPGMEFNMRNDMLAQFHALEGSVVADRTVLGLNSASCGIHVHAHDEHNHLTVVCADHVVACESFPNLEFANELRRSLNSVPVHVIGDAQSPGRLEHAIESAYVAANSIDKLIV